MKRVRERNEAIDELAAELNCPIDDLYGACLTINWQGRSIDGTHYEAAGYDILSDSVAKSIKKALK
jgi:lysophospholipase L1-like esterase